MLQMCREPEQAMTWSGCVAGMAQLFWGSQGTEKSSQSWGHWVWGFRGRIFPGGDVKHPML